MISKKEILELLPYGPPFLFVDELLNVDENGAEGTYIFKNDETFYPGHFKGNPITPGVILTECMAQIGLVCLGIFLAAEKGMERSAFALAETDVSFSRPVYPGDKVKVQSKKIYWRLGKLKCEVEMWNADNETVCHGEMSGMILKEPKP